MEYAVVRSDDYLAHYGVKDQKWGIRRYQNPDGTLTEEGKMRYRGSKLDRLYEKEGKKLEKYRTRADLDYQRTRANLYNKRAGTAGKAALAGAAVAVPALAGYSNGSSLVTDNYTVNVGGFGDVGSGSTSFRVGHGPDSDTMAKVFVGAMGVAAVSAGVAAYNKVKARVAERRISETGHIKAQKKYEQQCQKMISMFADTPYADLVNKQTGRG